MADQKLKPDVRGALEAGTFSPTGTQFRLEGQLNPTLYKAVNAALVMLGGKWDRSSESHVFPTDARHLMECAIRENFVPDMKKRRQAFYTPDWLVREVFSDTYMQGSLVLEPSAGGGAIARFCRENGATVRCVEIDQFECGLLKADGFDVRQMDFLCIEPEPIFDLVAMNPPFAKKQDVAHVEHALKFLRPGGKLVAIVSPSFDTRFVSNLIDTYGLARIEYTAIEAGAFKQSGTGIATRRLVVRTYEDIMDASNASVIEFLAHALSLEVIHGAAARRLSNIRSRDEMQSEVRIETEAAARLLFRSPNSDLLLQAVGDGLLGEIREAAYQDSIEYYGTYLNELG